MDKGYGRVKNYYYSTCAIHWVVYNDTMTAITARFSKWLSAYNREYHNGKSQKVPALTSHIQAYYTLKIFICAPLLHNQNDKILSLWIRNSRFSRNASRVIHSIFILNLALRGESSGAQDVIEEVDMKIGYISII